ncbi:hypothetical protein HORIV_19580 [Vreelandella olivaria]|uniref:Nudix hydrolase domain-containing protein n=1 Tax=Vreelandella olivaria TaxID=390919 RepID=A0ABM7GFX7_9GAMM|nr:hypothetical protein HORIV_19580 [Halomonas olivaria]
MVEEQRGGPQSVFNQPAGHIEPGEGPVAAILREVVEETAWQVSLTGYLGLYVFIPALEKPSIVTASLLSRFSNSISPRPGYPRHPLAYH